MSYPPSQQQGNASYPPPIPGSAYGGGQGAYGYRPYEEPTRVSGVAVASLILAILGCIPFVASALAAILGLCGIVITSNPKRSGRMLAVFGFVLGLLGLGLWAAGSYIGWKRYGEPFAVGVAFQESLQQKNLTTAASLTAPPFDKTRLAGLSSTVQQLGEFQNWSNRRSRPTTLPRWEEESVYVPMTLEFENGSAEVVFGLDRIGGDWRVTSYEIHPIRGPGSRPTSGPWLEATTLPASGRASDGAEEHSPALP